MWQEIKRTFNIFRTPSALELAARELDEAERSLLEAQTAKEYAEAMCMYHGERIDRLQRYIHAVGEES